MALRWPGPRFRFVVTWSRVSPEMIWSRVSFNKYLVQDGTQQYPGPWYDLEITWYRVWPWDNLVQGVILWIPSPRWHLAKSWSMVWPSDNLVHGMTMRWPGPERHSEITWSRVPPAYCSLTSRCPVQSFQWSCPFRGVGAEKVFDFDSNWPLTHFCSSQTHFKDCLLWVFRKIELIM